MLPLLYMMEHVDPWIHSLVRDIQAPTLCMPTLIILSFSSVLSLSLPFSLSLSLSLFLSFSL